MEKSLQRDLLIDLSNSLYNIESQAKKFSEKDIDDLIMRAISLSGITVTPDEYLVIKRRVLSKCLITIEPGTIIAKKYVHSDWYTKAILDIEQDFWNNYRHYLVHEKKFNLELVDRLENDTLFNIMNQLGNPKSEADFLRRGLIIGDVQSGKTSTYIGLISKAADAGYQVLILLTGTIEALRQQTQSRVEEGFVGVDISKLDGEINEDAWIGVGKYQKKLRVTVMTSRGKDFVENANKIVTSINDNKIILFIIKKNVTVLSKLTKWLIGLNLDAETKKIPFPMLLIDDEADNASINTGDQKDPSRINKKIRDLLNVFSKSNYVGFTATPYANTFISTDTVPEMVNLDLFPEDFIISLPTPSNYIGPKEIFLEGGRYRGSLVQILDAGIEEEDGYSFYYLHPKSWRGELPNSLTTSIYYFLLVNAVRDLRNDTSTHRSMLVNISRFIDVQKYIKEEIETIFRQALTSIKYNMGNAVVSMFGDQDPIVNSLHIIFDKYLSHTEFGWKEIEDQLYESSKNIRVVVVNSGRDSVKLDYEKHKYGLRVIAIGGLALSRGLTLEGLCASYFYRNTATYDVLMQMGRWFGYRENFEDLFKIWCGQESIEWYSHITEATEELKKDMVVMNDLHRTPNDFGIRVRNDCYELMITAPNKMKTAREFVETTSYSGSFIQTPYVFYSKTENEKNHAAVKELLHDEYPSTDTNNKFLYRNIRKDKLINFLDAISVNPFNLFFNARSIASFLSVCSSNEVDKWDVCLIEGNSSKSTPFGSRPIKRSFEVDELRGKVNIGTRGQLTGPSDALVGISRDLRSAAEQKAKREYENEKRVPWDKKNFAANTYFKFISADERNPLLLIYYIDFDIDASKVTEDQKVEIKKRFSDCALGFALGFPKSQNSSPYAYARYKYNGAKYTYEDFEDEVTYE